MEIEQIGNSGIYKEVLGSAIFHKDWWTVAGSIQLPSREEILVGFEDLEKSILKICDDQNIEFQNNECSSWQLRLDTRIRIAKSKIEEINFFDHKEKSRNYRGLVDLVP